MNNIFNIMPSARSAGICAALSAIVGFSVKPMQNLLGLSDETVKKVQYTAACSATFFTGVVIAQKLIGMTNNSLVASNNSASVPGDAAGTSSKRVIPLTSSLDVHNDAIVGKGPVIEQTFPLDLSQVTSVKTESVADVVIHPGSQKPSVTVSAQENIVPCVNARVDGKTLTLEANRSFTTFQPIAWTVNLPEQLNELNCSGTGSVRVKNLQSDHFICTKSGAGNVTVDGQVNTQTVRLSGTGSYQAAGLKTKDCTTVKLSGVGTAFVHAGKTLNATVSGVGSVLYTGASTVIKRITGLGSVKESKQI